MLASSDPGGRPGPWPAGEWILERKLDGLRTIAVRHAGAVQLWSRNHRSFTARFPGVVAALLALPAPSFVVDGEVVAFDGERSSFGLLQRPDSPADPVYCAFDLLSLLDRDTTALDVLARRDLLRRLVGDDPAGTVRTVEVLDGDPAALLDAACERGWEGLVAKRRDSPYRSGRSRDWRKLKCRAGQELVIGGWTEPAGGRTGLGALLVGHVDPTGLRYAGRVGTGFDEDTLRRLRAALGPLEAEHSPFVDPVRVKGAHWVRPELVAAVTFTEWTGDGRLRHPSFDGLRPDKAPADVHREPAPGRPGRTRTP